jgi:hypothetical protein
MPHGELRKGSERSGPAHRTTVIERFNAVVRKAEQIAVAAGAVFVMTFVPPNATVLDAEPAPPISLVQRAPAWTGQWQPTQESPGERSTPTATKVLRLAQGRVAQVSAAPEHPTPPPTDLQEWRETVEELAEHAIDASEARAKNRDRVAKKSARVDALRDTLRGREGEVALTIHEHGSVSVADMAKLKPSSPLAGDRNDKAKRREVLAKTVTVHIGPDTDFEVLEDKLATAHGFAYPKGGQQRRPFNARPLDEVISPEFYEVPEQKQRPPHRPPH